MDKYVKVRKIGQGSFGCAYLATRKAADSNEHLKKQEFVIKEVILDPRDQANAQREARLLAALDHPNIIACKESFVVQPSTPNAAFLGHYQQRPTVLCIVTEFADGGDLSHELARRSSRRAFFDPDELLGLFVQVCLALKHLHDRKILHRDVKPANIFLTKSGVVKLGDLGVATVLSHTLACAQTSIGTPYYTAPEICLGKRYNAKADVWSLGCVLFEMVSFIHAFEGRSQRQLFDNIVRGVTPQLPACGSLSSIKRELQTLVDDMLHKEPRARPSVNQLIRRPLVLARIQSFLSARALASELNHTVLHGENVFRKKTMGEDKAPPIALPAQHIRRAEFVTRTPALKAAIRPPPRQPQQKLRRTPPHVRNGKARVGSLLAASRKPRGLPHGALKRSRPLPKRVQPARVPARVPANNVNIAKQRAAPTRAKRPEAFVSAQAKAKLKAQLKMNQDAAAAVAALPDPPSPPTMVEQARARPPGKISERVAAFNTKWAAQREQLVPPPPPAKVIAKKIDVSKKPKQSARAYPKPVVIGVEGKTLSTPPPPAPVGIRRQQAKQKTPSPAPKPRGPAVRDSQPSLREHRLEFQRKKQVELASAGAKQSPKASPLDDPIILVQQLSDFKHPSTQKQVAVLPPPAPTTLTSSLPEFADKDAGVVELASDSMNDDEEEDHELTSLPLMANLEFERMVLQLKSVVESDMTPSDDENDDEDEQPEPLFDPNTPPPPYSPPTTTPFSLETLSISVLEDPAFRLALQKRLLQHKSNGIASLDTEQGNEAEQLVVDPAQQATLTWMHTYISSLT
ncbi:Serine/threonine-protein kinase Nek1 [Phytophthora ramorum]|uniref:Serine/threonine-protein kinase Nek1 n=1 Tax=Phytophthora ramorum TaxID=164328 RepID=UPI0030B51818|nr:Serine/threonine-protein kinase Nek1 [Phytophthora ramorum]